MVFPKPILSLLLSSTAVVSVLGHGGMVTPESRAIRTMGLDIDSSFGWPISMRPGGDCLGFDPDTHLQTVPFGQSKIEMRANDGANHIGPCTVYLVDPDDVTNKLQVGELDDCMRSLHPGPGSKGDDPIPAEMTIDIPTSGLPCSVEHCVLEFYWEATHLEPHEIFNNCADVVLGGASSASAANNESSTEEVTTEAPHATTEAPSEASEESETITVSSSASLGGTYVSVDADSSMKESMDQWCNENCNNDPPYCPESTCVAA